MKCWLTWNSGVVNIFIVCSGTASRFFDVSLKFGLCLFLSPFVLAGIVSSEFILWECLQEKHAQTQMGFFCLCCLWTYHEASVVITPRMIRPRPNTSITMGYGVALLRAYTTRTMPMFRKSSPDKAKYPHNSSRMFSAMPRVQREPKNVLSPAISDHEVQGFTFDFLCAKEWKSWWSGLLTAKIPSTSWSFFGQRANSEENFNK